MAMQSAWLLGRTLEGVDFDDPLARAMAGRVYARAWHRQFALRIGATVVLSFLAMRPGVSDVAGRIVETLPGILTFSARLSGKTKQVRNLGTI